MDNKLTDPNPILTESTETYFTDMYSAGETKEQLIIGQEVAEKNIATGTIDTSDALLTKVDNIYRLSVADPTGKIFSMTIDGQSKTFQNTTGYTELETALQTWLGVEYIVEYDTGTYFNISRVDGQEVLYGNPNLVRNIALSNTPDDWNIHSKIDIIIDGVTYQLLGTTYSDSTSALNYLVSTLTGATYFVKREGTNLVIARKDGAVPSISKTQYNRYTYNLYSWDSSNPTSSNLGGINGTQPAKTYITRLTFDGTPYSYTLTTGITWAVLDYTYDSPNFAGSPNWTVYNSQHTSSVVVDMLYSALGTGYTKSILSYTANSGADSNILQFGIIKDNYGQIALTGVNQDYVIDSTLAVVTNALVRTTLTETNHLADITTTTYTEIAKSLSLTSNNYFIKTGNIPNTIRITAVSGGGSSTGEYKRREQSCTAKYGVTTEVVADKIFKTDASNYGNIVLVKRGGFVITWTTNTSNKLDYVCE